ncbi:putative disease resistance RPP13-like protein 1 [Vitis vinifera]|uniref:Putative disease resistance RPP13-like protein 1 n=1 Tax=Vitis vinifera TaxID=29760 RepID=A0A438I8G3_VITVI|nr:putative disease resistance RPP13-like protein 1 [Vitis vinifera]
MAGFVGEAVLSGLIQKLIDMVTSLILHDAEEKHMTDPLVKMWLDELGDLAYDVEDILDSFATEALRRNLMAETLPSGTQPSTSKLRSLIPSCCTSFTPNSIKFNAEMWSKFKKITAGLQEISAQKNDLHLTENIAGKRSTKTGEILPTTSLVDESRVYGRETDKAAIVNLLLRDDPCTDEVCAIPVVGMAGIGKTTLAQLAFNDDDVKAHFDLRVWVYVSDDLMSSRSRKQFYNQFLRILRMLMILICFR